MVCLKCGRENKEDAKFCQYCGTEIGHGIKKIRYNRKFKIKHSKKFFVISIIAFAVIFIIVGISKFKTKNFFEENGLKIRKPYEVTQLSTRVYDYGNCGEEYYCGGRFTDEVIVVPCSVKIDSTNTSTTIIYKQKKNRNTDKNGSVFILAYDKYTGRSLFDDYSYGDEAYPFRMKDGETVEISIQYERFEIGVEEVFIEQKIKYSDNYDGAEDIVFVIMGMGEKESEIMSEAWRIEERDIYAEGTILDVIESGAIPSDAIFVSEAAK